MRTSWNGNIFHVTGPLWGESIGHWWLPWQRPVMRSIDFFFDQCLNKRLSKQSRGQWSEMPLCSLWHHCNEYGISSCESMTSTSSPHYWLLAWESTVISHQISALLGSVGNSHRSASPRPTTLEEDWELLADFSSILCLWFEIQAMRTYNFFWLSFKHWLLVLCEWNPSANNRFFSQRTINVVYTHIPLKANEGILDSLVRLSGSWHVHLSVCRWGLQSLNKVLPQWLCHLVYTII